MAADTNSNSTDSTSPHHVDSRTRRRLSRATSFGNRNFSSKKKLCKTGLLLVIILAPSGLKSFLSFREFSNYYATTHSQHDYQNGSSYLRSPEMPQVDTNRDRSTLPLSLSVSLPHQQAQGQQQNTKSGGLILTGFFGFAFDPRISKNMHTAHRATFETIYHFWMTVVHYQLHAVIFHDHHAFDEAFVKKYTKLPYIRFVQLEPPVSAGQNASNPNDFRYSVFNNYLATTAPAQNYKWYMISDRDMIFNRDPFAKLDEYHGLYNQTFFGSYDGWTWKHGAQGLQFNQCYGPSFTKDWDEDIEWNTPNGNCGLWAGTLDHVQCIIHCMKEQFQTPPVLGKGADLPCDMAVHDYCVFYGGCFPNQTKGVYSPPPNSTVRWGPDTMGPKQDLFGIPVRRTGRPNACIQDSWAVLHMRCGKRQKWNICYNHSSSVFGVPRTKLSKYWQVGYPNTKACRLDNITDLPLPNKEQI